MKSNKTAKGYLARGSSKRLSAKHCLAKDGSKRRTKPLLPPPTMLACTGDCNKVFKEKEPRLYLLRPLRNYAQPWEVLQSQTIGLRPAKGIENKDLKKHWKVHHNSRVYNARFLPTFCQENAMKNLLSVILYIIVVKQEVVVE